MDKVIQSVEKLELSRRVHEHLVATYADFLSFSEKLLFLDEKVLKLYLKTIKNREIVNNQETELEESFLIELYSQMQKKDSIEIAMKHFEDGQITKEEIKKLHRVVIKNSSDDDPKNYPYRTDNDKWVGSFGTGGRRIVQYYPPDYKELDELIDFTINMLNDDVKDIQLNHVLIKPFVVHALIAYLQPFGNGNTRLARVLQHAKIWQMQNAKLETPFAFPTLYLSENYLRTRTQYRELIGEVATCQNWDAWLNYNLNMVDEQLYRSGQNLERIRLRG